MKTALLLLLALSPTAMAAAPTDADLQQAAARQEQVRAGAQSLVARLDDVIAEYTRNGLATGDDFEALKAVREALGTLSDDEMEQVVTLLQNAGTDREQMAKAYAGQKDISLRLKQILAEHELDQDIESLASGVRQLADRQSANLSAAIDTAQLAAQDQSANGQAAVTASEQAQQSEETAIGAEVKLIADKLDQIGAGSKYRDAADELERVEPEAGAASDSLGAGKLDDAMIAEKAAREQLAEVARALMPAGKNEPAPTREAAELASLAHDQRALLAKTAGLTSALKRITDAQTSAAADKAMYQQIKNPDSSLATVLADSGITPDSPVDQIRNAPEMKAWLADRAADLQRRQQTLQPQLAALAATQAALAAKAQMVRDDLQKSANAAAAAPLETALPQMASAQQALASANGTQAMRDQLEAAAQLEQAERMAGQGSTAPALTPEQQLQQLQAGVNSLAARETASVQHGDALKTGAAAIPATELQDAMAAKAAALQQAAAGQSSPAAQTLQQAADALQNAAKLMGSGTDPLKTAAAQQAAAQDLAQAGRELAQEGAGIAHQKQALANMQRQMAGLDRMIQQQRQLGIDTEKGGTARAKQFARSQSTLQKNAANLQQALSAESPDAAQALEAAGAAMGDAAQKLGGDGADQAPDQQKAAQAALDQAQDALADQIQKTAQGLGRSFAPERAAAAAALDRARQALASGAPAQQATERAAEQLDAASGQPQALPQAARDAMRSARQALAEAAAGDSGQAQAQSAQAAQAMEAAKSALGEQQAGIAGLSSPSGAQGGNSQQPGEAAQQSNPSPNQQATSGKTGASEKGWSDQQGATTTGTNVAQGSGEFQGLPARDRAALQQSQSEKYPQEYGPLVEQYMRGLAGDSATQTP